MSAFFLLILFVVVVACFYGYRVYRSNMQKQEQSKKRNIYNDRV